MHQFIDYEAENWLRGGRRDYPSYHRFFATWTPLNQLYNFHCCDMHSKSSVNNQLASDLSTRSICSQPSRKKLTCGRNEQNNKIKISEWRRLACVVRFIPGPEVRLILALPEVLFFATRKAYSPVTFKKDVTNSGVLDVHRTKLSPKSPYYTFGFVNAWIENKHQNCTSSNMIQHLARLLYTVCCNLVHGGKFINRANDRQVVEQAATFIVKIVHALLRTPPDVFQSGI